MFSSTSSFAIRANHPWLKLKPPSLHLITATDQHTNTGIGACLMTLNAQTCLTRLACPPLCMHCNRAFCLLIGFWIRADCHSMLATRCQRKEAQYKLNDDGNTHCKLAYLKTNQTCQTSQVVTMTQQNLLFQTGTECSSPLCFWVASERLSQLPNLGQHILQE